MNYGLYLSAGGAISAMHRQDVIANNLANVETVAFKPDQVFLKSRLPQRLEHGAGGYIDPQLMLEQIGGGHFVHPTQITLKQGALVRTDNSLDLAIRGDGFFVVNSGHGEGSQRLRFTRDGRFTLNSSSELVMSTTGMQVLDENDRPIRLRPGATITIDDAGSIRQDGTPVARIAVAEVPDLQSLRKAGANLFKLDNTAQASRQAASSQLQQGYVEASAVDAVMTLNDMISATKTVEANAKLIQFHDNLTDQSINRFARVA